MRARLALALGLATLAVFARSVSNGFVSFDDGLYITANPHVLGGLSWAGLRWALASFDASNWHPVTWLSHLLDVTLFGTSPAGHHAVNVLLHAANAVLVFFLFETATGLSGRSAAAAALFALHPLRVESVAWASQRKDVLALFFGLLALLSYARFVRSGKKPAGLLPSVAFGALGLAAKPTLVALPLLMLLLDFWPFERLRERQRPGKGRTHAATEPVGWRKALSEKLPFFLLAAAASALTLAAQRAGGATAVLRSPLLLRLDNAAVSAVCTLARTLAPLDLAVLYPYPAAGNGLRAAAAAALLAAITAGCAFGARRRPYLLFGWLWFVAALAPTLGLVQVGWQATADRYTYLPSIGLCVLAVWGVSDLVDRLAAPKTAAVTALLAVLAALSVLTFRQIGTWRDSLTLWGAALSATRDNPMAQLNYGAALLGAGRAAEALPHFEAARNLAPASPQAAFGLGMAFESVGRPAEARRQYEEALRLQPGLSAARARLEQLDRN